LDLHRSGAVDDQALLPVPLRPLHPAGDFTASGLSVLGHVAGFFAASLFIVPIPWVWRWISNWMVSQISAQEAEAR